MHMTIMDDKCYQEKNRTVFPCIRVHPLSSAPVFGTIRHHNLVNFFFVMALFFSMVLSNISHMSEHHDFSVKLGRDKFLEDPAGCIV